MNDETEIAWTSGLTRSYSEHAAIILQHYQEHRHRLPLPEPLKCTRSGPEFHHTTTRSNADDDDEDEPDDNGHRTWRISSSEDQEQSDYGHCKILEIGCGDSNALSGDLSELNLNKHKEPLKRNYERIMATTSSASQNTRTSSIERNCRLFDDEDDENFTLIDLDDDNDNSNYQFEEQKHDRGDCENHKTIAYMKNENGISTSCTSLSTVPSKTRINGSKLKLQISYEDWACIKQRELQQRKDEQRRAEQKRRELEERERREREEKERRDYESYLKWLGRKKQEKQLRKELMEKELDLQKRIQEVEDKAKLAKNLCLRQWQRKKLEQKKAAEKEESMKKRKEEEEKQKRLQESLKAYELWREKAKNTPRPATQGLLPHQKAKPSFTNPTPWQPLVNLDSEESDNEKTIVNSNTMINNQRNKKGAVRG